MRVLAFQQGWMHDMMPAWGGGWLWMLLWLVVLVLVAVAAWKVIGMAADGEGAGRGRESALQILERRYARGEIDREEFERRKRDLRGP